MMAYNLVDISKFNVHTFHVIHMKAGVESVYVKLQLLILHLTVGSSMMCDDTNWNKLQAGGRHNMPPPRPAMQVMTRYTSYTHLDWLLTWCPCWPASTANKSGLVTLTFDLLTLKVVSKSCDVGYLCANFSLPRPLCSRFRPDVRDRHTSDRHTSDSIIA